MLVGYALLLLVGMVSCASLHIERSTSGDKQNDLLYAVPMSLNKQSFLLRLALGEEVSWVKGSNCSMCTGSKCDEKCKGNVGPSSTGMICNVKKPCKKLNQTVSETRVSGFKISAEARGKYLDEPKEVTWTVAEKLHLPHSPLLKHYDGEINLLHKDESFVFDHFSLVRVKKDSTLYVNELPKKYLDQTAERIEFENAIGNEFEVQGLEFDSKDIDVGSLKAQFSLTTQRILLPKTVFDSLMKEVLALCKSNCTIKDTVVSCQHKVNIDSLKEVVLRLKLADQTISIPFVSLVQEHSGKHLTLLVNQSDTERVVLGEALLNNFALTYDLPKKTAYLSRLANQWSTKLQDIEKKAVSANTHSKKVEQDSEDTPHTTDKPGITGRLREVAKHLRHPKESHPKKKETTPPVEPASSTIGSKFFQGLMVLAGWLVKLILFMVVVALVVNLYYHRKNVWRWLERKFNISHANLLKANNNGYSPAFEQQIDPTPSIAQGYDAKTATKQFWQENSVEGI